MFNEINKNVVTILGIDKLPVDKQQETMEKLGSIVYQEVMLRVLDIMDEKEGEEFEKLLETNPTPEVMFGYLAEKVPELDTIVKEEAQKIADDANNIMSQVG